MKKILIVSLLCLILISAKAFNGQVLGASDTLVFDRLTDGDCSAFQISNSASSTADALVRVTPFHDAGQYMTISPGQSQIFRARWTNITQINCKGTGATISGGIVER